MGKPKSKYGKAIQQSRCVVCKMRVQVNAERNKGQKLGYANHLEYLQTWGHSRYPMDHAATPNRRAIRWAKKLGWLEPIGATNE